MNFLFYLATKNIKSFTLLMSGTFLMLASFRVFYKQNFSRCDSSDWYPKNFVSVFHL
ncbi:hypothetical protein J2S11_000407 [Bacillus horti]|uniref:Uncharacterized protein n=1 Tax=Caldalkalibacillus horti TaxID=77523 RepID=A0ABT9VU43_9BACI|nr:hypothetical protein [Bacillus horti]